MEGTDNNGTNYEVILMKEPLRKFTDLGMDAFREQISNIKSGSISQISEWLLQDKEYSEPLPVPVMIENKIFPDKYDAAVYLSDIIDSPGINNPFSDKKLWSWLAAFYLEQLCKTEKSGRIKPGAENRYILYDKWSRRYRHALAIPVMMYRFHGETATLFLQGPLNNFSDVEEQLLARQEIAQNTNVITVAKMLYWDADRNKIKSGISSKEHNPGTLRRFVAVINQLNLNYDLYSMRPENILEILPSEFSSKNMEDFEKSNSIFAKHN